MPGDVVIGDQGLTEPAITLIERVSAFVGGVTRPYQIVRVAKADAKAVRIRTESAIEIEGLRLRAAERVVEEQTHHQLNMENITRRALTQLAEDASPQDMDDDWIANFFDKCRNISDEDMQKIWSRVLAGEANSPGKFSRKTINILNDLEKRYAMLFQELCGFSCVVHKSSELVVFLNEDEGKAIYHGRGINLASLLDIESLGLVNQYPSNFLRTTLPQTFPISYFGRSAEVSLAESSGMKLKLGSVLLTTSGRELASICSVEPVEGFFQFICAKWERDPQIASIRML